MVVTSGLTHVCAHVCTHTALKLVLLLICFLLSYLAPESENIVINRMGEGRGKERNEGQKGERRLASAVFCLFGENLNWPELLSSDCSEIPSPGSSLSGLSFRDLCKILLHPFLNFFKS